MTIAISAPPAPSRWPLHVARHSVERSKAWSEKGDYTVYCCGNTVGRFRGDRQLRDVVVLIGAWLRGYPPEHHAEFFDAPGLDVEAWGEPGAVGTYDVSVFRLGRLVALFRHADGRHVPIRTDALRPPRRRRLARGPRRGPEKP